MSELAKEFGELVRQLRNDQGLTQPQLADAAGLSEEWIRRIERGLASPSFETIEALATALGVDATPPLQRRLTDTHVQAAQLVAGLTVQEADWLIGMVQQLRAKPGQLG